MAQYKFFSSAGAEVMDRVKFVRFGQLVDLPEEVVTNSRLALLPVNDFDAIFSADDVKKFAGFGSHAQATDDFKAKLVKATQKRFAPPAPVEEAPAPVASGEKE
jgi:hypothetical protein